MINENTPIETYLLKGKKVYVKRDDLMGDGITLPKWGKLLGLKRVFEDDFKYSTQPITNLTVYGSWSGWVISHFCKEYGIPYYNGYPNSKKYPKPLLDKVEKNGGKLLPLRPNMFRIVQNKHKSVSKEMGLRVFPFANNHPSFIQSMKERMEDVLKEHSFKHLVVSMGSGVGASGLIQGFLKGDREVHSITTSTLSSVNKVLKENNISTEKVNIYLTPFPFDDEMVDYKVPFDCNQFWDKKMWYWLEENIESLDGDILFWNLGGECMYTKTTVKKKKIKKVVQPKQKPFKLPYSKNPFVESKLNITFHEINQMNSSDFRDYALNIRNDLKKIWIENGIPPYIGKPYKKVIKDFQILYTKDLSLLERVSNDNNYEYIIENNWREGSTCNQFFPQIHKVQVDELSLWDLIIGNSENSKIDKSIEIRWMKMLRRGLKDDYLYEFSKRFTNRNEVITSDKGFVIHKRKEKENLTFTKKELFQLLKNGILKKYHLNNIEKDFIDYDNFEIRWYEPHLKIFNNLIHILRVSNSNTPVNFHPSVAKFLYEKYLPKKGNHIVLDTSSGFGGRLLGSLLSQRNIHYIGFDVNSSLYSPTDSYNSLGEFVYTHITTKNSFSVHQVSSTKMGTIKGFNNHIGKVDLILTSPPYFSKERYSNDKEQSFIQYPTYQKWLNGYLKKTFELGFKSLKIGGYCLINISDINFGNKYLPLELDTINILEECGFQYEYQIGMKMKRFIGIDTSNVMNRWWDEENDSWKKVEPILVFRKKK